MSKREAFLDAVCKENIEDFLNFITLHKDLAEPLDVNEVVQELSNVQREALWVKLVVLLRDVLLEFPPEKWDAELDEEDKEDDMEGEVSPDLTNAMLVLEGVTLTVTASVEVIQDSDTYSSLLECAQMLNDVLASLPVSELLLRQAIYKLCETWWKKGLDGKEEIGRTAFLGSLEKTFILKKPGAEMHRLWAIHEVLLCVDFDAEDNKQMIDLLLQCFLSANHIRNDDGKRLMVFLFSCDINFIHMIHSTIKNQLQYFTKTLVDHIAEIYFRAWKKACGGYLEEIETTCIQDLMQHAVLLHRTSPVHSRVRQIMSYFHKRKGCKGLDEMLCRLYKPILWRALNTANSEVRANATLLFTEAFPVHDPAQSIEKIDETIQKQLDTLVCLLEDPQPLVRSTATLGVCKILAKCWEVIPPTIVADFLKKLVVELAADISSPDVRCSVFKCLTIILDNALSHPLLEQLLPALRNSLHDSSEKVRVAFLDMLLKIKAVRAAKFWKVCSMDHLLARLAEDSPPIAKRIVNLLFNSFFPVNLPEEVWCERCITLIQMNPKAARKFFQYAYLYTAPTNIAKLMLTIRRCLNACIQSEDDLNKTTSTNKENTSILDNVLSVKDTASMASLLEVVAILWRSIRKTLELNKEAQLYTTSKFGAAVPKYFNVFQDERCTVPLIVLASLLPPAAVPTFSCGVLSRLRKMDVGAKRAQYSQVIDCLCGWGQGSDILELITDWLTEAVPKTASKATTSRKLKIQSRVEAKPDLGLDYLDYMVSCSSTRDVLLSQCQEPLQQLHKALGAWRAVLYTHLSSEPDSKVPSAATALKAFTLHGRLSAHLQHKFAEGREFLVSQENMATWVTERVLLFFSKHDEGDAERSEKRLALAVQIVESFLMVSRDMIRVGVGDEEFSGQILRLGSVLLLSENGYLCVPLLLSVLKEVAENYVPEDVEGQQDQEEQKDQTSVILCVVANVFQKLLEVLVRQLKRKPEESEQLCQLALPGLADFLLVVQAWMGLSTNTLNRVFSTVFAAVIVESRHALQKISQAEEVIIPESTEDFPPLSRILLSAVLQSPLVTRAFLAEITSSVDSDAIDCLTGLVVVLHILAVIRHTGKFKDDLKRTAMSVQMQLQHYSNIAEDEGSLQRVIYESSNTILNDILKI